MAAHILVSTGTAPVDPAAGAGALAPDLVHSTVIRTADAEFAVGWADDDPQPDIGALRHKEN